MLTLDILFDNRMIKNDTRDALSLARLHRAGELTPIYVPNVEDEALRDLVRARSDAKDAGKKAKQQLAAFLLRYHITFSGKTKWSKAYFKWLADISMPHPAQQITLQEYIDTVNMCDERVKRITEQIRNLAEQSRLNKLIKAFESMRGISLVIASTLASELGDFSRFEHPEEIMAYLGLIPSEFSSGEKQHKGSITKTGNGHVRRVLIESAWCYRFQARRTAHLQRRAEKTSEEVQAIAWKAQKRLCGRYQHLLDRGKLKVQVCTAIARELAGFIWAIACEVMGRQVATAR
jgi:transposase